MKRPVAREASEAADDMAPAGAAIAVRPFATGGAHGGGRGVSLALRCEAPSCPIPTRRGVTPAVEAAGTGRGMSTPLTGLDPSRRDGASASGAAIGRSSWPGPSCEHGQGGGTAPSHGLHLPARGGSLHVLPARGAGGAKRVSPAACQASALMLLRAAHAPHAWGGAADRRSGEAGRRGLRACWLSRSVRRSQRPPQARAP